MRLSIIKILVKMGMKPSLPKLAQAGPPEVLSVLLDGEVIGTIPSGQVEELVKHLRRLKLSAATVVRFRSSVLIPEACLHHNVLFSKIVGS